MFGKIVPYRAQERIRSGFSSGAGRKKAFLMIPMNDSGHHDDRSDTRSAVGFAELLIFCNLILITNTHSHRNTHTHMYLFSY